MNINKELKQIYRAKDCTDLNDVENSLSNARFLARRAEMHNKPVTKIYKRIISLEKKRIVLI